MTRSLRSRLALVAGAVALLAFSACGGDDDPDAAAGREPSVATTAAPAEAATTAAEPAEVTIEHAQGETTVPVNPETVVVFDLGVLVTLHELGVEVDGVPEIAALSAALPAYDDVTKVGTLFEPDYEQVNALEPDLIIVASRSSSAYPDLAKIAPTVDLTVDNADFLASFRERTEALGRIFALEDEIAARLDAIDAAVEETRAAAADAGTGLIVLTTGGEVSAYGPGSRFGIIHDDLGVAPAVEDVEEATHGDAISFEFILEADPDILYVIDRDAATGEGGAAAEQVLDNELVRQTKAWRNGKVVYLDPFTWYLAPSGLTSVEDMLATIAASVE